jgi:dTDP-4-amino-4,6-dideoxygalactose transaminase
MQIDETSALAHADSRTPANGSAAGGRPMLFVAEPVLGPEEKAALCEVIDSGWITMGPRVRAFEQAFAELHGVRDAVAVDSCTAALHLILEALGIGPGDEVLVPSLTFVATANAVVYVGGTPVFVDIESPAVPLISVEDAERKRTSRTKAVIVMHYGGHLAERDAWRDFAARHGLLLIEDAAHAPGVAGVGSFGDAAAFSFYGNKNVTTAEGGMVLARNAEVLERVRLMRGHGLTRGTFQRTQDALPHYDVTMLGYNFRMDELRAAIGLVQLGYLARWNARRGALVGTYRQSIAKDCPSLLVPFPTDTPSAHHIMPIVLPAEVGRDRVIMLLREAGIQTTIHYPPVHQLSFYRQRASLSLPITDDFARRQLTLPLHPRMDDGAVAVVVAALADALSRL